MIEVSKEQFNEFIKSYCNELVKDCCGIFEPPIITYNDFTLGMWPKSVVAHTFAMENSKYFIADMNKTPKYEGEF